MSAQEKVSAQEFTMDTTLIPEAIREACGRAAEAGMQFMGSKIYEHGISSSVIGYVIEASVFDGTRVMELAVGWEDLEDGRRRVTLEVGDNFATKQWQLYGFIPLSPKSPAAMGSLKRFSERLRKELSS